MIYLKYRVWCEYDSRWEYVILENTAPIPFKCPTNTSHDIDEVKTSIEETIDTDANLVKLDSPKTTLGGLPKFAVYEAEGESATVISHNFCDKCSWFSGSLKITDGALSYEDGVWKSNHTHWIDMTHGRTYDEDVANVGGMYNPIIKVNGTVTTLAEIDYEGGSVTIPDISEEDEVTATYYYATTSYYALRPRPGKILAIKAAEIQFTQDVVMTSPFAFEVWAWINHPTAGRIQVPVPGTRITYKNAKDFISACNEGQGLIPKWGELNSDVHVFPFHYARPKPLRASQEVEIRVFTLNHTPPIGQFATTTFYVTIDNEITQG